MQKLFGLKEMTGAEALLPDLFFQNKQDAKKERQKRNLRDKEGTEILNFVVTRGPDHWLGLTGHSSHRTPAGTRKGAKRAAKGSKAFFNK